jgi:hypothetical protein
MNLKAAIKDMADSIRSLSYKPVVKLELQEKGSPRLVTIVPSTVDRELRFGDVKATYTLSVRAHFSSKDTDPANVLQTCRDINDALCIDRRRGGNALTTITDTWAEEENEGRALIVMVSEPQIQLIESC